MSGWEEVVSELGSSNCLGPVHEGETKMSYCTVPCNSIDRSRTVSVHQGCQRRRNLFQGDKGVDGVLLRKLRRAFSGG